MIADRILQKHPALTAAAFAVSFLALLLFPPRAGASLGGEVLVDFDAAWRYHDGNVDLGNEWRDPAYDDSGWSEGEALLGYDTRDRRGQWPDPGLRTELEEHLITYYFRKEFEYEGPTEGVRLRLDQIIDDAAVYYLNGVEVARSALMPEGEAGFGTEATGFTNPWVEHETLTFDAVHLREGRNVLAVSVHNDAETSSDICLGARLTAEEATTEPLTLYLTWQRDPTTTMTVHWHTAEEVPESAIQYRAAGEAAVETIEGGSRPMPHSDRYVHTAEITGLEPDGRYEFRIHRSGHGKSSPVYSFRTMPATADEPVRFAGGGDVRHRQEWMEATNRQVARFDPHFVVWGGDLAYADGHENNAYRWYEFFEAARDTLITEEGRVIPMLAGIGNHEVRGGYYWSMDRGRDAYEDSDAFREELSPYYYSLFAFPGHPGHAALDFGDYMSIILLDTDHNTPVEGPQTEWLEETLSDRDGVPHLFPVYHVPGYPSHRSYEAATQRRVREHWVPLFERYGVRVAFENHDHTYKRTVPISNGEAADDGVVFIGDGAWGVGVRDVHSADDTWYLERSQSIRHFILTTIQNEIQDHKVISSEGNLIDHYITRARN